MPDYLLYAAAVSGGIGTAGLPQLKKKLLVEPLVCMQDHMSYSEMIQVCHSFCMFFECHFLLIHSLTDVTFDRNCSGLLSV